ncbi:Protein phosphatase PP2A regulatory subunit B [Saxophila tyrrhenica]|uniref:Protein phosphatase PP2A regulatory subunit B n=1 Tax=Saxophila tyrrhenica TaxID=1690608 RepID=A0AAV9PE39_9PEZI|nr:Protein phosphatase PP2A regulatory subunit B [Saxophila tyrrhenica]
MPSRNTKRNGKKKATPTRAPAVSSAQSQAPRPAAVTTDVGDRDSNEEKRRIAEETLRNLQKFRELKEEDSNQIDQNDPAVQQAKRSGKQKATESRDLETLPTWKPEQRLTNAGDLSAAAFEKVRQLMELTDQNQRLKAIANAAIAHYGEQNESLYPGVDMDQYIIALPFQKKQILGNAIYPKIAALQPELVGKITGMLIENGNEVLLKLTQDDAALRREVDLAVKVYNDHVREHGVLEEELFHPASQIAVKKGPTASTFVFSAGGNKTVLSGHEDPLSFTFDEDDESDDTSIASKVGRPLPRSIANSAKSMHKYRHFTRNIMSKHGTMDALELDPDDYISIWIDTYLEVDEKSWINPTDILFALFSSYAHDNVPPHQHRWTESPTLRQLISLIFYEFPGTRALNPDEDMVLDFVQGVTWKALYNPKAWWQSEYMPWMMVTQSSDDAWHNVEEVRITQNVPPKNRVHLLLREWLAKSDQASVQADSILRYYRATCARDEPGVKKLSDAAFWTIFDEIAGEFVEYKEVSPNHVVATGAAIKNLLKEGDGVRLVDKYNLIFGSKKGGKALIPQAYISTDWPVNKFAEPCAVDPLNLLPDAVPDPWALELELAKKRMAMRRAAFQAQADPEQTESETDQQPSCNCPGTGPEHLLSCPLGRSIDEDLVGRAHRAILHELKDYPNDADGNPLDENARTAKAGMITSIIANYQHANAEDSSTSLEQKGLNAVALNKLANLMEVMNTHGHRPHDEQVAALEEAFAAMTVNEGVPVRAAIVSEIDKAIDTDPRKPQDREEAQASLGRIRRITTSIKAHKVTQSMNAEQKARYEDIWDRIANPKDKSGIDDLEYELTRVAGPPADVAKRMQEGSQDPPPTQGI